MSLANIAFLVLVVSTFTGYGAVLAFGAWWSNRPDKAIEAAARSEEPVEYSKAA